MRQPGTIRRPIPGARATAGGSSSRQPRRRLPDGWTGNSRRQPGSRRNRSVVVPQAMSSDVKPVASTAIPVSFVDKPARRHPSPVGPKSSSLTSFRRRQSRWRALRFFKDYRSRVTDDVAASAVKCQRSATSCAGLVGLISEPVVVPWLRNVPAPPSVCCQSVINELVLHDSRPAVPKKEQTVVTQNK